MKTLQDLLDFSYMPHRGDPFNQTYVVPGTVDPSPFPDHDIQGDHPDMDASEQHLFHRRGFDDLLDALYQVVNQRSFETEGPYTMGGKSQAALSQIANVTGVGSVYTMVTPFDTDCEYAVLSAHFGAAGQAVLSRDPSTAIGPALTATYDGGSYQRVVPFFAAGEITIPFGRDIWFPLPASDQLYWAVNMAAANTSSALITLAFRRPLNRHGRYQLTIE